MYVGRKFSAVALHSALLLKIMAGAAVESMFECPRPLEFDADGDNSGRRWSLESYGKVVEVRLLVCGCEDALNPP